MFTTILLQFLGLISFPRGKLVLALRSADIMPLCRPRRCILLVRTRPSTFGPQPASCRARVLPESAEGPGSISEPAPYLVLGDGDNQPSPVGCLGVIGTLAHSRSGGFGTSPYATRPLVPLALRVLRAGCASSTFLSSLPFSSARDVLSGCTAAVSLLIDHN